MDLQGMGALETNQGPPRGEQVSSRHEKALSLPQDSSHHWKSTGRLHPSFKTHPLRRWALGLAEIREICQGG